MTVILKCAVLVIGGGSAGVGAAWRAALCGADTVLIEPDALLGGTSTLGGVNEWEPGIASFGLNRRLFARLDEKSAGIGCGPAPCAEGHIGLNRIDRTLTCADTLRRAGVSADKWARVQFEPIYMAAAMDAELRAAGVRILYNTRADSVLARDERIEGVEATDGVSRRSLRIAADAVIDCTGDAVIARMAGCRTLLGEDARARFDEPSAPETAGGALNGVTVMFRAARGRVDDETPRWAYECENARRWFERNKPASHVTEYPNGERCFNPLPIMTGEEYFSIEDADERRRIALARTYLYWQWMKDECGHGGWHIAGMAARDGVRESWRLNALSMLTEREVRGGFRRQGGEIIALADHALDTHGAGAGPKELEIAYGVPMGCLIAREYANLLAAGRCCGLSHIAAASCRLSRTMMDLGEAAGALAVQGGDLREGRAEKVRGALDFERYLDWADRVYR